MIEKPLFWHQGLFLQPQHLQLSDRWIQGLTAQSLECLAPYLWGVESMQVQTAALDNRSFQLLQGKFIFPDATFATLPDNAVAEARNFEEAWQDGSKPLDIYLGLRKWNPSGQNVTVTTSLDHIQDVNTRYVTTAEASQVSDLHTDGPEAQIQQMYLVLKLFWETELDSLGDWELIPIARLERDQDRIRLATGFIPPCISIAADQILFNMVKEIRDQISARCRQLEAYKSDRGLHSAEFGSRDMVYLLALRSLNRYASLLEHMTAAGRVHPWQLYGLLRQLIGELSTFSGHTSYDGSSPENQALPTYDHRDLGACFSSAQDSVTRLLDEITAGPDYVLAMDFDGTYYATELPPAVFEGRNRFYLMVESEADPKQTLESMVTIAKLGSRESLPILIARSLSGVGMTPLDSAPQSLPRKAGALYFQIDLHDDQWSNVVKGRNLALYWDAAPEDLKIELMIVARS